MVLLCIALDFLKIRAWVNSFRIVFCTKFQFLLLQEGLMSFEEESIDAALKALEETEKKCQVGDGFMKSVKKKFSKKKRKEVKHEKQNTCSSVKHTRWEFGDNKGMIVYNIGLGMNFYFCGFYRCVNSSKSVTN